MTVVCANENTTQTTANDDNLTAVCSDENVTPTLEEDSSDSEDVDLEISVTEINAETTVDISWNVRVQSLDGTSKNVIVMTEFPSFVNIVGYSADCGTFDPVTNIWTIGDLVPDTIKSIKFYGLFKGPVESSGDRIIIYSKATTDSNDISLSNNDDSAEYSYIGFGPVSSQSGNGVRFNLASYLPTYKYNSYRTTTKKVKATSIKKPKNKTVKKSKKKKKKKKKK
jgi:hypothetical protein